MELMKGLLSLVTVREDRGATSPGMAESRENVGWINHIQILWKSKGPLKTLRQIRLSLCGPVNEAIDQ